MVDHTEVRVRCRKAKTGLELIMICEVQYGKISKARVIQGVRTLIFI